MKYNLQLCSKIYQTNKWTVIILSNLDFLTYDLSTKLSSIQDKKGHLPNKSPPIFANLTLKDVHSKNTINLRN